MEDADDNIRETILDLAEARRSRREEGQHVDRSMIAEARAFEAMILRSANLVFATTNSGAVEDLLDEGSLFDWTMIEEAGKATGRRTSITPFAFSPTIDDRGSPATSSVRRDCLVKLLSSTEAVKSSLKAAQNLITRYLREPGIEEIFNELDLEDADCGRLCADTMQILVLFETMVLQEIAILGAASRATDILQAA